MIEALFDVREDDSTTKRNYLERKHEMTICDYERDPYLFEYYVNVISEVPLQSRRMIIFLSR